MLQEMQLLNYSSRTITTYIESLQGLSRYYNLSPDLISVSKVKDYLYYCIREKKLSTSSINQIISAFKVLHVHVLGRKWEGLVLKRPRREVHLPEVLSREEIRHLLDKTMNLKHRSIMSLAYSTGMRANEILQMMPQCIDSDRKQVKVNNGKGKKQRYTIISTEVIDLLREYYKRYLPEKYLFEGMKRGQPLSYSSLCTLFRKNLKKAGINKPVGIHCLRHSFATHLMEQGVNIKLIQQLLGHSSIRTTTIYLHVAKSDFDKIVNPIELL